MRLAQYDSITSRRALRNGSVVRSVVSVPGASTYRILAATFESFADIRPWIDFEYAQGPLYDLSVSGSEWGHLLTAGALWLGLPLVLGVLRILRAEVK